MSIEAPQLYLDLLKRCLTNTIYEDPSFDGPFSSEERAVGRDCPRQAHTMIGRARLDNLHALGKDVLGNGTEGDFLEAGVWRGGASIFMRGFLKAYGSRERRVWVADSFEGLPPPDAKYPADAGSRLHAVEPLRITLNEVRENFERYGLLDDQVQFLPGWFKDTLAEAPIDKLALLRLDGDMYGSTIEALDALYEKITPGGFVIIDDYGAVEACQKAVEHFRAGHRITSPLIAVDWTGVYWQKEAAR